MTEFRKMNKEKIFIDEENYYESYIFFDYSKSSFKMFDKKRSIHEMYYKIIEEIEIKNIVMVSVDYDNSVNYISNSLKNADSLINFKNKTLKGLNIFGEKNKGSNILNSKEGLCNYLTRVKILSDKYEINKKKMYLFFSELERGCNLQKINDKIEDIKSCFFDINIIIIDSKAEKNENPIKKMLNKINSISFLGFNECLKNICSIKYYSELFNEPLILFNRKEGRTSIKNDVYNFGERLYYVKNIYKILEYMYNLIKNKCEDNKTKKIKNIYYLTNIFNDFIKITFKKMNNYNLTYDENLVIKIIELKKKLFLNVFKNDHECKNILGLFFGNTLENKLGNKKKSSCSCDDELYIKKFDNFCGFYNLEEYIENLENIKEKANVKFKSSYKNYVKHIDSDIFITLPVTKYEKNKTKKCLFFVNTYEVNKNLTINFETFVDCSISVNNNYYPIPVYPLEIDVEDNKIFYIEYFLSLIISKKYSISRCDKLISFYSIIELLYGYVNINNEESEIIKSYSRMIKIFFKKIKSNYIPKKNNEYEENINNCKNKEELFKNKDTSLIWFLILLIVDQNINDNLKYYEEILDKKCKKIFDILKTNNLENEILKINENIIKLLKDENEIEIIKKFNNKNEFLILKNDHKLYKFSEKKYFEEINDELICYRDHIFFGDIMCTNKILYSLSCNMYEDEFKGKSILCPICGNETKLKKFIFDKEYFFDEIKDYNICLDEFYKINNKEEKYDQNKNKKEKKLIKIKNITNKIMTSNPFDDKSYTVMLENYDYEKYVLKVRSKKEFIDKVKKRYSFLDKLNFDNICIAGGFCRSILLDQEVNDIDFFIYGFEKLDTIQERVYKLTNDIYTLLKEKNNKCEFIIIYKSNNKVLELICYEKNNNEVNFNDFVKNYEKKINVQIDKNDEIKNTCDDEKIKKFIESTKVLCKIQIILVNFKTKYDVIKNFDLDACKVVYDNKNIYFTERSINCFKNMTNHFCENSKKNMMYSSRIKKYLNYGFRFLLNENMFEEGNGFINIGGEKIYCDKYEKNISGHKKYIVNKIIYSKEKHNNYIEEKQPDTNFNEVLYKSVLENNLIDNKEDKNCEIEENNEINYLYESILDNKKITKNSMITSNIFISTFKYIFNNNSKIDLNDNKDTNNKIYFKEYKGEIDSESFTNYINGIKPIKIEKGNKTLKKRTKKIENNVNISKGGNKIINYFKKRNKETEKIELLNYKNKKSKLELKIKDEIKDVHEIKNDDNSLFDLDFNYKLEEYVDDEKIEIMSNEETSNVNLKNFESDSESESESDYESHI